MKKVFMSIVAVAMLSLVACGGGNKSAGSAKETGEDNAPKTEIESESSSDNLFDEYVKLIGEATPLIEKMAQGDAEASGEFMKISEKLGEIAVGVQKELENDPEKLKQFQDIAQKYAEEVQKAMMPNVPK
jgi:hypothetical protein